MGEARRRKKFLGSKYGKPSSKNFQAVISDLDQTNQEINRTELSRPPIPELEYLKLKLNSVELSDWLISEWSRLPCFEVFVTPKDVQKIVSKLLDKLSSKFLKDLSSDPTIRYALSPLIEVKVGINVYNWTVWASVVNSSKGFLYITSDDDEFELV